MKHGKTIFFLSGMILACGAQAQDAALVENTWSNPQFVDRFMGSYGFDSEITPKISSDEQKLFKEIAPLIADQPDQALALLKTAIKPDSSAALNYTMGNIYFQNRKLDEAIDAYEAAIKKFPDFYRAHKNLALLYVQNDRTEDAFPHIVKALSLRPADSTLYGLLGLCHLRRNDFSSALQAYNSALMLEPDGQDWLKGRLRCLMSLSMFSEANAMLETMIAEHPEKSELWLWQANTFIGLNRNADAITDIEVVKAMGKADAKSLNLLADMYMNNNMPDAAVENYRLVLKSGHYSAQRMLKVADVLVTTGHPDEATVLLDGVADDKSISGTPEERSLLGVRARIAMNAGDDSGASKILEQIIVGDPLNGKAHLLLGDLYTKQGRDEEAVIEYENAQKDAATKLQALIQHARLSVNTKDYTTACTLLRQYLTLDYRQNVADFLEQVDRARKAQASL